VCCHQRTSRQQQQQRQPPPPPPPPPQQQQQHDALCTHSPLGRSGVSASLLRCWLLLDLRRGRQVCRGSALLLSCCRHSCRGCVVRVCVCVVWGEHHVCVRGSGGVGRAEGCGATARHQGHSTGTHHRRLCGPAHHQACVHHHQGLMMALMAGHAAAAAAHAHGMRHTCRQPPAAGSAHTHAHTAQRAIDPRAPAAEDRMTAAASSTSRGRCRCCMVVGLHRRLLLPGGCACTCCALRSVICLLLKAGGAAHPLNGRLASRPMVRQRVWGQAGGTLAISLQPPVG
jgi:hypothetical protein